MSAAALIVNTPSHADDWPAWTDEARWWPTEDYPGLTGSQVLLLQLYEQAARLRIDAPTSRQLAEMLGHYVNHVVCTRRILIRKSWLEEQPTVRLGQYRKPGAKRYRLTQAALDRMVARDAKAKGGPACIAS